MEKKLGKYSKIKLSKQEIIGQIVRFYGKSIPK